ncbi:MAG: XdhC family protein [Nocardiopsaceae bacterium]|nr:XdhC family protein [Nocardiopsaceae bacterium]
MADNTVPTESAACDVAHTPVPAASSVAAGGPGGGDRTLIAVFAAPVSAFLLRYAADAGFRGVLVEPDTARAEGAAMAGFTVAKWLPDDIDEGTDIVVTDHHRAELGIILADALKTRARWIGLMGSPRHEGPHVEALTMLGVKAREIDRIHRPIGLDIGSRTPPEIAVSTLAGLLADRNSRSGGFYQKSLYRTN